MIRKESSHYRLPGKGKTVNGPHSVLQLNQLKEAITFKRRGNLRVSVVLLQDSASVHTSQVAVAEASNCGNWISTQHPYLLDIAPSYTILIPKFTPHLRGHHFRNNDEITCVVEDQDTTFFRNGIAMHMHRWTRYIAIKRDYIDKKKKISLVFSTL